jgi:hypothetical protein
MVRDLIVLSHSSSLTNCFLYLKTDFEHFSENLLTVTDLRSRRRPDRIVVGFINIRIGNMFCQ